MKKRNWVSKRLFGESLNSEYVKAINKPIKKFIEYLEEKKVYME